MSKQPLIGSYGDEIVGEKGGSGRRSRMEFEMSKPLCLRRCSGQGESDMSKRPCLRRCSGYFAESDISVRPLARCSCGTASRPAQRQHLYLVVDDWDRGYSVYRFDEDDFDSEPCQDDAFSVECPFFRMEAQHPHSLFFVAHGTKILAMQPKTFSPGIMAFDTETLGVSTYPDPHSRGLIIGRPVYASVGGKLLVFHHPFLELLGPEPTPSSDEEDDEEDDEEEEQSWSWTSIENPPFVSSLVSGYAVHPDGRTVFVSVRNWRPDVRGPVFFHHGKARNSTFTFDMEHLEWRHVGEWLLPFKGRGFYDRELDAWVGLCLHKEGVGRVCSCDVPPASGCETLPAWKLGRDVFFDTEGSRSDRHLGATLVHKGDSRFFLLESRKPKNNDPSKRFRVVNIISFALKYDKDGDLRQARHCTYASKSYQIGHKRIDINDNPVAFYL